MNEPSKRVRATRAEPLIVGVAASAGGIKAIRMLLAEFPADVMAAFVIIQHMSPRHRSLLAQLLARDTLLEVRELSENIVPISGSVYVAPPNADVVLEGGMLRVIAPSPEAAAPKPSADRFFDTLADYAGMRAVGVVLSGTGSDGTEGLKKVREAGGRTFVQDPETAEYDGMPNAAIAAGNVDETLDPKGIAQQIVELTGEPGLEREETPEETGSILEEVRRATNVDFSGYKPATLHRRIARRMALLDLDDYAEYAERCARDQEEVIALHRDLLISVTSFHRDPEQYDGLRAQLPRLLTESRDRQLRIWVAGCATGEEAYSLAFEVADALGEGTGRLASRLQIFATDIDEEALRRARVGRYPQEALSNLPSHMEGLYFETSGGYATVKDSIRETILFSRHDVAQDPPFINIDLVSCRNVLIYFGAELQDRAFRNFHYSMRDEGLLFLGKADSVIAARDLFSGTGSPANLARKRTDAGADPVRAARRMSIRLRTNPGATYRTGDPASTHGAMFRALAASLGETSLMINEQLDITTVIGDATPFIELREGALPAANAAMLADPLAREARLMAQIAKRRGETRLSPPLTLERDPDITVRMSIHPLIMPDSGEQTFLLAIRRENAEQPPPATDVEGDTGAALREELDTTRAALDHAVEAWETASEELTASNEELQANNEELQAINEELETSNEELQSTNEELITVNEALQVTTQELNELNDDLVEILRRIDAPLLILNETLIVTTFSNKAREMFRMPRGAAEPHISQLPLPPGCPSLQDLANKALEQEDVVERSFTSGANLTRVSAKPFTNSLGVMIGVSIMFAQADADETRFLLEETPAFLMLRDRTGMILRISHHYASALGLNVESAIGKNLRDVMDPRIAEEQIAHDNEMLDSGEGERSFEKVLHLDAAGDRLEIAAKRIRFRMPADGREAVYIFGLEPFEELSPPDAG